MLNLSISYANRNVSRRQATLALLSFIAAAVTLSAGGWIYVAARPGTHIYNIWNGGIASTFDAGLPDFVLYSLPDGLWTLSSILMLHPLLRGERALRRLAIVAIVPMLGIASETLQWLRWLPGVFDICDLACYAIPLIAYFLYQSYHNISKLQS